MAKLDPRADPVSSPPSAKDDFTVDRVAVPKDATRDAKKADTKAEPKAEPKAEAKAEAKAAAKAEAKAEIELDTTDRPLTKGSEPPSAKADEPAEDDDDGDGDEEDDDDGAEEDDDDDDEPADRPATKITSQDPRYEPLEKLLDLNDWKKISAELGSMSDVGKLPPNLGLLAALAHNENAKDGDPDAAAAAIRCMAGLLGVSDDSPIARVLARRMLRKNPVKLTERQAPPARTSFLIVLITLALGGGVGFVASAGSWHAALHMLHLG